MRRMFPVRLFVLIFWAGLACSAGRAQTTAFTYQGKLTDGGAPASGAYDLQFKLFDTADVGTGTQQPQPNPPTITKLGFPINAGIFTVELNFGANAFPGALRYLEIGVRRPGENSYTPLSPRQFVSSTPYALRSLNASSADSIPVTGVPAGSGNYIQNTISSQASSNFNISGNGTVGQKLRVEGIPNGILASFGANGDFQIDAPGGGGPGGRFTVKQDGRVNVGFAFSTGGARFNIASGEGAGFLSGLPSISLENVQGGFRHWITTRNGGDDAINFYLNDSNSQNGSTAPGAGSVQVLTLRNFRTTGFPTVSFPRLGIGELNPLATLDLRGGAGAGGANNPNAVAFQWKDGGFRHWISTRHNATLGSNNAIDFYVNNSTTAGGSSGPGVGSILVMTLDSGKVGIGPAAPDQTLSVTVGTASKPGGGSWAIYSDERLKNIKGRFTPGLKAVMQLQPLRYEYKRDNGMAIKSEGEHIGFSAQAVQKIIPEAVIKNDKGYLLVDNDPIIWTMLNAMKEQQAQIERQQKLIDQQQKQLDGLKQIIQTRRTLKNRTRRTVRHE